jgi:RNA 2',3'-cyclic 3'-phosphodiesterase
MRAFIAIELPEFVREALRREQARFREVCPDARWTRPEGIHLTLKFLGDISSLQEAQVKRGLALMERFEKFTVPVQGFGFFPDVMLRRTWDGWQRRLRASWRHSDFLRRTASSGLT